MRFGFALPQYDYSVPSENPLRYDTIEHYAQHAETWGFDSLWLSDHLFLDLAKYGGSATRYGAFEPLATLAALAGTVTRARLGTLVLCEALRPATVLAKTLATLDLVTDGRLDVGLGAGWYEPDYEAIGLTMPSAGERVARLREALDIVGGLLGGEPHTLDGTYHRSHHAVVDPPACQVPRPPLFVGGKGDRMIRTAVEYSDGWNTCWVWTPDQYRERLEVLERACDAIDRDPATVWRSLGLYTLVRRERIRLGPTLRTTGCTESEGSPRRHDPRRSGARGGSSERPTRSGSSWRRGRRSAWRPSSVGWAASRSTWGRSTTWS